jgi:tetratricopeptide (TPR) repeat protein
MKRLNTITWLLVLIVTLMGNNLFAQIDDELDEGLDNEMVQEIKCKPDTLLSDYEIKFRQDSITFIQQERIKALSLGYEYYKQKLYEKAIPYLWKVTASGIKDRYYKTVIKKLIESYYNLGKKEKGEKAIALMDTALLACYKGLDFDPDYITFHYWAGLIQYLLKRYQCAIPHYEKLTELEPKEKSYWETLAALYFVTRNEKAIQAQNKVIELDPNDEEARRKLAVYTQKLGGSLYDTYKELYEKYPDNAEYAMKFAMAALDEERNDEAIQAFKRLLKLKPGDPEALKNLGKTYQIEGKYSLAIKYYKQFLTKNGSDPYILVNIADCYRGLKKYASAVSYARKALRAKPGFGEAYIIIGKTYMDAVSDCSSNRTKGLSYDDKLVYERAYNMFKKAKRDEMVLGKAASLMKSLKPVLPTREDKFLHRNRTTIKDKCYSWIQ